MVLKIKKSDLDLIFQYSRDCHPMEACGILVGKIYVEEKIVEKVYPTKNILASASRYEIDPEEQIKVFNEAEKEDFEVLGFYHSHPFWAPYWSEIDEEQSKYWKGFSYLIISLKCNGFKCFVREERVREEDVIII